MSMNKKDIALTVGGILASMVVAYLIYKMQQRDSANAAASEANDAAQSAAYLASQQEQDENVSDAENQLASSNNSITSSTSTPSTSTSVSTDTPDTISAGANDLISSTIAAFAAANQSDAPTTSNAPSLITAIPDSSDNFSGIATTAQQALDQSTYGLASNPGNPDTGGIADLVSTPPQNTVVISGPIAGNDSSSQQTSQPQNTIVISGPIAGNSDTTQPINTFRANPVIQGLLN